MNKFYFIFFIALLGFSQDLFGQNSITDQIYRNITEELENFSHFEDLGGAIIYEKDNLTLSLGHLRNDSLHVITLEKVIKGNRSTFQLLDTLNFVSKSKKYNTDLIECDDINNKNRKMIFGFYQYEEDKEYFEKIVFAWTVILPDLLMKEINSEGIKCENIGYGI
ncbi:MAG: hypothetical protein ABJH08_05655 [Balneola sp.]